MKLTKAQLATLLAITLAAVAMAVPASMGVYGGRFRAFWFMGLYFSSEDGFDFGGIDTYSIFLAPVLLITVALGIGHLVHSLVSKTADKWLNRCAGGVVIFFSAFSYLIGIYLGGALFVYGSAPIGLSISLVAGLFGFWATHLTRQERNPERQPAKEGM